MINFNELEIDPEIKKVGLKSRKELIEQLSIKDIVVKSIPDGFTRQQYLSNNEWQ